MRFSYILQKWNGEPVQTVVPQALGHLHSALGHWIWHTGSGSSGLSSPLRWQWAIWQTQGSTWGICTVTYLRSSAKLVCCKVLTTKLMEVLSLIGGFFSSFLTTNRWWPKTLDLSLLQSGTSSQWWSRPWQKVTKQKYSNPSWSKWSPSFDDLCQPIQQLQQIIAMTNMSFIRRKAGN